MAITTYRDPFDRLFDSMLGGTGSHGSGGLMRAPETDVVETERELGALPELLLKRRGVVRRHCLFLF